MALHRLYSIAEVAAMLGVSTRSIYRFMRQERNPLAAAMIGGVWRISDADLQRFIDSGRKYPQAGEK